MDLVFGAAGAGEYQQPRSAAESAWLSSTKTTVTVNQRALVEKILARYAVDFFLLKELIQNADDAQATTVCVDLTTDTNLTAAEALSGVQRFSALSVTNRGGRAFDESGWERIVEIATGNPDENSVGHFGVGFYSVFAASECPRIHSGDRVMELSWDANDIRIRRSIEAQDVDETVVSLPLKRDAEARSWDLDELRRFLARALCFPKHIKKLSLTVDGESVDAGEFEREQEPEAQILHPLDPSTGQRFPSQRGYFWITQVSQRWVRVSCDGSHWNGQLVSVEMEQRTERGVTLEQLNSGIEAVIGKRPMQRPEIRLLYDDVNDSNAGDFLIRSISPSEGSGIFVGFDTGLTAGTGFHTCGSFLPTMERTNLDMTHPQIQIWNQELLAVAGYAARLCYEYNMSLLDISAAAVGTGDAPEQVTSAWWSMQSVRQLEEPADSAGSEKGEEEDATQEYNRAVAMQLMLAHQFRPDSGPNSSAISQCIGFAFWKFPKLPPERIPVLTNKGIRPIGDVFRVPLHLSGIEDFISAACMPAESVQQMPDFVKRAEGHKSGLQELSLADATRLLGEATNDFPLSLRGTIKLLRWFTRVKPSAGGGGHSSGGGGVTATGRKMQGKAERIFCDLIGKLGASNGGQVVLGELMSKFTKEHPALKKQIFMGQFKRAVKWFENSSVFTVRASGNIHTVSVAAGKGTVATTAATNRVTLSLLANVQIQMILGPLDGRKFGHRNLASFTHFPRDAMRGTPTPPEVLPLCITEQFSAAELQKVFELQPLESLQWFAHFKQHQTDYCEPKTCTLFLKAVVSTMPSLSAAVRSDFVDQLGQISCIPCEHQEDVGNYGQSRKTIKMFRPDETYLLSPEDRLKFQGWDLPRPGLQELTDEFLVSIGVRTEPHVKMVLDNATQKRWSLLQVVDYLVANQANIIHDKDWIECKDLVVRSWFSGSSALYLDKGVSRRSVTSSH